MNWTLRWKDTSEFESTAFPWWHRSKLHTVITRWWLCPCMKTVTYVESKDCDWKILDMPERVVFVRQQQEYLVLAQKQKTFAMKNFCFSWFCFPFWRIVWGEWVLSWQVALWWFQGLISHLSFFASLKSICSLKIKGQINLFWRIVVQFWKLDWSLYFTVVNSQQKLMIKNPGRNSGFQMFGYDGGAWKFSVHYYKRGAMKKAWLSGAE